MYTALEAGRVFACSAVQTDRTNARKAAKNTSVNYGRLGQR